ncbi:UPF0147 family protein [Candidatus Marsarchaeota archaeon]|jgi:uncharacterized protein (UPF0147 family)|nr:UPF0147 family protein [Candidatus Marsarchaeota archaeon]MCL5092082.1 UPF0147 family protein [Candidatus Marsarchaeota archaeon]
MKDDKLEESIKQINMQMDAILNDTSVPKNVRSVVGTAKEKLNEEGDYTVRISSAIYNLDSVSNDINLPPQARTIIWSILSMLESVKE